MEVKIPVSGHKTVTVYPCIKCGCDDINIGDCGYSSFNIAFGKCTNKDCKHEVQFGCGCFIEKESIIKAWNSKNDPALISKISSSEIGSPHWFSTLMATMLHTGEFLTDKTPDEQVLRSWGQELYNRSSEMIEWFEKLPKDVKEKMNLTYTGK